MNCEEIQILLAAELYGDNSPDESQVLKTHLASCESCRAMQAGLRNVKANASGPSIPQDDAFWIRQKSAIMGQLPERSVLDWVSWPRLAGPVAALGVMISVWGWHHQQEQTVLHITQNMDLLQNMDMLQQLDVVQDLDTVEAKK